MAGFFYIVVFGKPTFTVNEHVVKMTLIWQHMIYKPSKLGRAYTPLRAMEQVPPTRSSFPFLP